MERALNLKSSKHAYISNWKCRSLTITIQCICEHDIGTRNTINDKKHNYCMQWKKCICEHDIGTRNMINDKKHNYCMQWKNVTPFYVSPIVHPVFSFLTPAYWWLSHAVETLLLPLVQSPVCICLMWTYTSLSRHLLAHASRNASIYWKYNSLVSLAFIFCSEKGNFPMSIHWRKPQACNQSDVRVIPLNDTIWI
jgi:hypothetical protein